MRSLTPRPPIRQAARFQTIEFVLAWTAEGEIDASSQAMIIGGYTPEVAAGVA